jgi:hypothetical protein
LSKTNYSFANFEIDKSDSGSNFVANDRNSTTGSTNRVLATDLMRVSTELGNLGYNTGAYQGLYTILILIKELLNLIGILMTIS